MSHVDATPTVQKMKETVMGLVQKGRAYSNDIMSDRSQLFKLLALIFVGLVASTMAGITFTGTAVFLALATPIFIFFSPILVPLATIAFLVIGGFLSAASFCIATIAAAVWLYQYLKGDGPVFSGQVDAARTRIITTAVEFRGWAVDQANQVRAASSA